MMAKAPDSREPEVDVEALMVSLRAFMKSKGLHESTTRDLVVETFLSAREHLGLDDILQRVRARHPGVGMATVYRTMRLLEEAGLVQARHFGSGPTLYEVSVGRPHHDHLVCEECGQILEFVNEPIERLQEKVAAQHGFELLRHRHELFGVCARCRQRG
jgi:Fur family ferric uptake transcriptional regulator